MLQNFIVCAIVVIFVVALARAKREPLWAEAYRRLGSDKLAIAAMIVMCLYGLIGFLDSIGRDQGPEQPRISVIDRLFERPQERTYSAPLATVTTGEPHPHKLRNRHLLGTDVVGNDVFYETLKGCRTALIIGGVTQMIVTPLALFFGLIAGYFGKRVDDAVQYLYTVLAAIPGILLLIALLLVLGHGLLQMCIALGVTSWVGLCRLVRGETLKQREKDYVRAARALGLSHARIIGKHILPNMLPLVIISVTLGFSGMVLSETILSYLGLGVEPGVGSWGNMIDAARLELAREPVVWWNLTSATAALFILMLAFNILGDALRDAIDPRLRS